MKGKKKKLELYKNAHSLLTEALKEFPETMWKYKPSKREWSIHEIIIHIADSEASSYFRCRRFIAEPNSMIPGYSQDTWAVKLEYHNRNTVDAIELFRHLRKASYELIKNLPDSIWKNICFNTESGVWTFEFWLEEYSKHIPVHIAQMRRVYGQYLKANKKSRK